MELTLNDTSLSEAEVVRAVLAFLEARGLSRSLDALERESGGLLAQGQLPPRAAVLRRLVVGGRWEEASAALKNLLFDPNAALFHLMRQKYLELICVYEELGNDLCDDLGHAVALCFSELSSCCPSLEEHDELRRLARLSRPSKDPCMSNWDPLSGRRRCFEALRLLLPAEESTTPHPPVDPGRLTDLIAKGLLYEADHGSPPVEVHLEPLERREAADEGWTETILMRAEEDECPGRERFWNRRIQDGLVDGAPEILRRAEDVIGRWEARYRPAVKGEGDGTTPMGGGEVKRDLPGKVLKEERPCTEEKAIVKRELKGDCTAGHVLREKKPSTKEGKVKWDLPGKVLKEERPCTEEKVIVKRELKGDCTAGHVLMEKKPSTKEEKKPFTKKEEGKVKREIPGGGTANRVLKEKKPSTEEVGKVKQDFLGDIRRVLEKEGKPSVVGEVKRDLLKGCRDPLEEGEAEIPSSFRAYASAEERQNVRDLLQAKDRVREKLLQVLNNDRTDSRQ